MNAEGEHPEEQRVQLYFNELDGAELSDGYVYPMLKLTDLAARGELRVRGEGEMPSEMRWSLVDIEPEGGDGERITDYLFNEHLVPGEAQTELSDDEARDKDLADEYWSAAIIKGKGSIKLPWSGELPVSSQQRQFVESFLKGLVLDSNLQTGEEADNLQFTELDPSDLLKVLIENAGDSDEAMDVKELFDMPEEPEEDDSFDLALDSKWNDSGVYVPSLYQELKVPVPPEGEAEVRFLTSPNASLQSHVPATRALGEIYEQAHIGTENNGLGISELTELVNEDGDSWALRVSLVPYRVTRDFAEQKEQALKLDSRLDIVPRRRKVNRESRQNYMFTEDDHGEW